MKSIFKRLMTMAGMAATFAGVSTAALAAESGMRNWQLGFQDSVSGVMDDITWFNMFTLVIITVITLFDLALLALELGHKVSPFLSLLPHLVLGGTPLF